MTFQNGVTTIIIMRFLKQLAIILAFAYAGEMLSVLLPVKLPSGVSGLLLLFAALASGLLKPRHIGETADALSGIMAFFFLPLAVTIIQNFSMIRPVIWQVIVICVVSTVITFFVSYGTVRLLRVVLCRLFPGKTPAA